MDHLKWKEAMLAKGHTPRMLDPEDYGTNEDGSLRLDVFVTDSGPHNGPGCKTCGWSTCMHCNRRMDIPPCS